jgi:hypothetical protein
MSYQHISYTLIGKTSDSGVTVCSNCDQVSLHEGDTLVETKSPDGGTALIHPPCSFTVNASANRLRADCLMGGAVSAQHEWRRPGTASWLLVEADRSAIFADRSDFSRVIVSVVDAGGHQRQAHTERGLYSRRDISIALACYTLIRLFSRNNLGVQPSRRLSNPCPRRSADDPDPIGLEWKG